jgi:hypothetical protein
MEVPDITLYLTCLLSAVSSVGERTGGNAAKISTPGALASGCSSFDPYMSKLKYKKYRKENYNAYLQNI